MSEEKLAKRKHPHNALTTQRVRSLTEPGHYADGHCLYLVIDELGRKKWVQRLTIHGRRHDLGLGSARLVSLSEARDAALRWRKVARAGGDPLVIRRQERQVRVVPIFEDASRQVHEAHAETFRNETHSAQWLWSLEKYVWPQIGKRRVDDITSADVIRVLSPIWLKIPETARRVRQRLKTVFHWAKANGYRTGDNPVEGVTEALPKHDTKTTASRRVALRRIADLH